MDADIHHWLQLLLLSGFSRCDGELSIHHRMGHRFFEQRNFSDFDFGCDRNSGAPAAFLKPTLAN
jgi:hypothetical protein